MFLPSLDLTSILARPEVQALLERQTVTPPPAAPPPMTSPVSPQPAMSSQGADRRAAALDVMAPLFAIGTALGGSPTSGAAFLHGNQVARAAEEQRQQRAEQLAIQRHTEARLQAEQTRIAQAQQQAAIAQEEARETQRQRQLAAYVLDVNKRSREFTTKDDHDQFVQMADALAVQNYGARPGAVMGAAPFVPVAQRERALKVLDRYRKLAPDGRLMIGALDATGSTVTPTISSDKKSHSVPLASAVVQFDVDGDGVDESVPFAKLEEYAGEAFYGADGQRLVPNTAEPVATYGQTFTQARGTVFADKPLPTNAKGQPDYGKALRDLHALNPPARGSSAVDRRQARAEAQTQARDRLYTAVLNGDSDAAMAQAFGESFRALGLGYRAEVAKIRREINAAGQSGMSPEDRELSTPADVFRRGVDVLTGPGAPSVPAVAPVSRPTAVSGGRGAAPATGGRGGGPPYTVKNDYLVAREVALKVLDAEAVRRGLPPGSVTEEQVAAFLRNPANRKKLQQIQ